jgi:tetratricopeptide (TPR) repeat protein
MDASARSVLYVGSALQWLGHGYSHDGLATPERIDAIRTELEAIPQSRPLLLRESELLVELLDHWMLREQWDPIIEWASRAILQGCSFRWAGAVYRYWLEALVANHDTEGVFRLSKHLLSFRKETNEFVALALYGLCKIDRPYLARPLARHLLRLKKKSQLVVESLATHAVLFGGPHRSDKALALFAKLTSASATSLLTNLNWYMCALESENHDQAASALEQLSQNHPEALELLRVAAHVAIDEGDWSAVVRHMSAAVALVPFNHDERIALAGALEYAGELYGARAVLSSVAASVSRDDYDFWATSASVHYKLHRRYHQKAHRQEALIAVKNALRVCRAYGVPSSNFLAMEQELNATRSAREATEPRFWIAMASDEGWRRLLQRPSFLVKVPAGASAGDVVFLCRGSSLEGARLCDIDGAMRLLTSGVPDEHLGNVAKCGHFKMFDKPVRHVFEQTPELCRDGHGLLNFSGRFGLFYSELSASSAEKVLANLEAVSELSDYDKVTGYE